MSVPGFDANWIFQVNHAAAFPTPLAGGYTNAALSAYATQCAAACNAYRDDYAAAFTALSGGAGGWYPAIHSSDATLAGRPVVIRQFTFRDFTSNATYFPSGTDTGASYALIATWPWFAVVDGQGSLMRTGDVLGTYRSGEFQFTESQVLAMMRDHYAALGTAYSYWGARVGANYVTNTLDGGSSLMFPFSPPVPSNTVSDAFARADSSTSIGNADTGQSWTALAGTWGLTSGRAYVSSAITHASSVIDSTKADCSVATVIIGVSSTGAGLALRMTDWQNGWLLLADALNLVLLKLVAGVATTVASAAIAFAEGDTVSAILSGSNIVCRVNDVAVFSTFDSFNSTATKHGLAIGSSDTVHRWTGFSVRAP